MAKTLFKPGTKVAVCVSEYGINNFREDFVDNVYETGNFTLKSYPQQWKPNRDGRTAWQIGGDVWNRKFIEIWDDASDTRITAAIATANRISRHSKIIRRLECFPYSALTDAMLDVIESVLDNYEKRSKK